MSHRRTCEDWGIASFELLDRGRDQHWNLAKGRPLVDLGAAVCSGPGAAA